LSWLHANVNEHAALMGEVAPGSDRFPYFVTIRCVGATVLVGAMGEIENVSHVFHPAGRLAASNSP
jgi:hypothetical protein